MTPDSEVQKYFFFDVFIEFPLSSGETRVSANVHSSVAVLFRTYRLFNIASPLNAPGSTVLIKLPLRSLQRERERKTDIEIDSDIEIER